MHDPPFMNNFSVNFKVKHHEPFTKHHFYRTEEPVHKYKQKRFNKTKKGQNKKKGKESKIK